MKAPALVAACLVALVSALSQATSAGMFDELLCPLDVAATATQCGAELQAGSGQVTCCDYAKFRDCLGSSAAGACGRTVGQLVDKALEGSRRALGDKQCDGFELYSVQCIVYFHQEAALAVALLLALALVLVVCCCCIRCCRGLCCGRKPGHALLVFNPRLQQFDHQLLVADDRQA